MVFILISQPQFNSVFFSTVNAKNVCIFKEKYHPLYWPESTSRIKGSKNDSFNSVTYGWTRSKIPFSS